MSDPVLKSTLQGALRKPISFAFVANGPSSRLLAGKKKISPKDAAEAKKEAGGGTIYKGRCKGENGTLVFEVAKEPPSSLAALLKKIMKQETGLTYPVEVRVAADAEEELSVTETGDRTETDSGGVPPLPPTAPPSPTGAETIQRLNGMLGNVKAALAGPNKSKIQSLLGAVNGLIASKDFASADKGLDELSTLLQPPVAPAAAPTSPPPPAAARFATRLKALAPVMEKAAAADATLATQAKTQVAEGNKAYLAKQYDVANAALDRAEALIKQAFASAAVKPTAAPPAQETLEAEWERRVGAIEPRVLEAQKKRAGEAKWMTLFMSVQDLGSEGNYAKALDVLNRLEALLNAVPSGVGSTGEVQAGTVEKRKFLITRFQELGPKLRPEIDKLRSAIAAQLPQEDVGKLCGAIEKALQTMFDQMQSEIDAAINAGNHALTKGMKSRVLSNELVKELVNNPFVQGKAFETLIVATLDEVEQKLAA